MKKKAPTNPWSEEDIEILIEMYERGFKAREIGRTLDRPFRHIEARITLLGLRMKNDKPPQIIDDSPLATIRPRTIKVTQDPARRTGGAV